MRDHSETALTLLAELGFTTADELWAFVSDEDDTATPGAAMTILAREAAYAIQKVDDAERHANAALGRISYHHAREAENVANHLARNASWIAQATTEYAEAIQRIQDAITTYRANSIPFAAAAGIAASYFGKTSPPRITGAEQGYFNQPAE